MCIARHVLCCDVRLHVCLFVTMTCILCRNARTNWINTGLYTFSSDDTPKVTILAYFRRKGHRSKSMATRGKQEFSKCRDGSPCMLKTFGRKFMVGRNVAEVVGTTSSESFLIGQCTWSNSNAVACDALVQSAFFVWFWLCVCERAQK